MIHVVLSSVVSTLNEFIRNELNLQEDVVILTNAVDLSGNLNSQIDNKLDLGKFWLEAKNLEILTYCYLDRLPCISIRSDLFFDLASRMLRENPFALIREGYKTVKNVNVF